MPLTVGRMEEQTNPKSGCLFDVVEISMSMTAQ